MPAKLQNEFSWDDVRVFLALFRARTLSSAAVRLGVNASTVGRRLDALEGALGARLFDRTPDGVAPTAATEHLLGSVRDAVEGLGIEAGVARRDRRGRVLRRMTRDQGQIFDIVLSS